MQVFMRKLILVVHSSFDGFVASPDGSFDKFVGGDTTLSFVCDIIDDADSALFGRKSYQLLDAHWPTAAGKTGASNDVIKYSNWYNAVPKYVLSDTLKEGNSDNTYVINGDISKEINTIKQQPGKNILLFGGPGATQALIELNLLDGFWLILYPTIFGEGIPMFKEDVKKVIGLTLADTKQLPGGIVCMKYMIGK